ncbi:hypothetical protein ACLB2K_019814 [Fragaria x ananassa]
MALWMEKGAEPQTESERADLDAIAALKESAAIELKEKGNEFVKKGKKHYSDAIDCYTRAINNQALSDPETSVLFSNRAHVNLLLGNYRRALTDAEEAIRLSNSNVKALYRAAKACLSLNLLAESISHCKKGLEVDPSNEGLEKLLGQVEAKKMELEQREAQVSKALSEAKDIVSAIEKRGLKVGKPMYQELTGSRKPVLDKNSILHWPVLLLYPEVMSSDFIEDFCETEMFSPHLDMMFSESAPPLPWDEEHNYARDAVEIYYEAKLGVPLSKTKILRYLLEGTPASNLESMVDEEKEATENSKFGSSAGKGSSKWVKVNEKRTLYDILKETNFIIQGIPVFAVVSKRSSFYKEFRAGGWTLPQ